MDKACSEGKHYYKAVNMHPNGHSCEYMECRICGYRSLPVRQLFIPLHNNARC